MDVVARMHGGGVAAQAGALRHGISRALLEADPNLRGELKRRGFLTRDPRVKERKKAGPQEGPQAAAVLQALAHPRPRDVRASSSAPTVSGAAPGEFLTAELALQLARAAVAARRRRAAPGPDRPRHARVRRDARVGDRRRRHRGRRRRAARRRAADARRRRCWCAATGCSMAAVISASHNPYEDNGIKLFARRRLQARRRHRARDRGPRSTKRPPLPERIGRVRRLHGALEDYLRELHTPLRRARPERPAGAAGLRQRRHLPGGAGDLPPARRRGGGDRRRARRPQHQRRLRLDPPRRLIASAIAAEGYELAFAFDGDGDRVLAVDGEGEVVDGDELWRWPRSTCSGADRLPGDGVAVTVMTNYGFHTAMAAAGVEVATTAVGDRYVLDELRRRGWALGGEQSGHIIDLGFGPSGDGIASALLTLEALGGRDLRDRDAMEKLPQRLVNIRAADRSSP